MIILPNIYKSTLKIDFKEKVSLRFIINVRNFIESVEELECESIEYQYEAIILKVKCKK